MNMDLNAFFVILFGSGVLVFLLLNLFFYIELERRQVRVLEKILNNEKVFLSEYNSFKSVKSITDICLFIGLFSLILFIFACINSGFFNFITFFALAFLVVSNLISFWKFSNFYKRYKDIIEFKKYEI